MTNNKNLNDDFDFDELDFSNSKPLTDEEIKDLAEREVARFKEEQEHKRTVDAAYDKILGRFKAAPRNDQAHYEAFKAERLERFKALDLVANDICNKFIKERDWLYTSFKGSILDSDDEGKARIDRIIDCLADMIQYMVGEHYDQRQDSNYSAEQKLAIKALSIAIVDLAEGNI